MKTAHFLVREPEAFMQSPNIPPRLMKHLTTIYMDYVEHGFNKFYNEMALFISKLGHEVNVTPDLLSEMPIDLSLFLTYMYIFTLQMMFASFVFLLELLLYRRKYLWDKWNQWIFNRLNKWNKWIKRSKRGKKTKPNKSKKYHLKLGQQSELKNVNIITHP